MPDYNTMAFNISVTELQKYETFHKRSPTLRSSKNKVLQNVGHRIPFAVIQNMDCWYRVYLIDLQYF